MALNTPREIVDAVYPAPLPANVDAQIELADAQVSKTAFGDLRNQAVAYLAMHKMALPKTAGASGDRVVSSESEGGVSRSYFTPGASGGDVEFSVTMYGREYIRLVKSVSFGMMMRPGVGGG